MTEDSDANAPMRIDVWLWAARFYKTRSIAAEAVSAGHVNVNGQRCKRAKAIKPGDKLSINRSGELIEVAVVELSAKRGPAQQAQAMYLETPESRVRSELLRAQRTLERDSEPVTTTRPTKRDRRAIDRWTKGGT